MQEDVDIESLHYYLSKPAAKFRRGYVFVFIYFSFIFFRGLASSLASLRLVIADAHAHTECRVVMMASSRFSHTWTYTYTFIYTFTHTQTNIAGSVGVKWKHLMMAGNADCWLDKLPPNIFPEFFSDCTKNFFRFGHIQWSSVWALFLINQFISREIVLRVFPKRPVCVCLWVGVFWMYILTALEQPQQFWIPYFQNSPQKHLKFRIFPQKSPTITTLHTNTLSSETL